MTSWQMYALGMLITVPFAAPFVRHIISQYREKVGDGLKKDRRKLHDWLGQIGLKADDQLIDKFQEETFAPIASIVILFFALVLHIFWPVSISFLVPWCFQRFVSKRH